MGKQADADLILKLYDLRREKVMREARNWFFTFNPTSAAEYMETLMSEQGAYARMVISYWDMAASLVNNGAIDEQMFNDANGEHLFVFAKIEPIIDELRQMWNQPDMLKHYEAHAPLKRNVLPDELGATGVFLASDGAAAITGQVLYVDCGYQIMGM